MKTVFSFFVSIVTICVFCHSSFGYSFVNEEVDPYGNDFVTLKYDNEGTPHLVYSKSNQLKYAVGSTSGWEITTLGVGYGSSFDFNNDFEPRIAYQTSTSLWLVKFNASDNEWECNLVDTGDFGYVDIKSDDNKCHIAYMDQGTQDLKYAFCEDENWDIQTIDSYGNVGGWLEMALDSEGNPYISYSAVYNEDSDDETHYLKLAKLENGFWNIEFIDEITGTSSERWSSIDIDSNNNPHIVYTGDNSYLWYTYYNGYDWIKEPIYYYGEFPSFQLSDGVPFVAFGIDYGNSMLLGYKENDWIFDMVNSLYSSYPSLDITDDIIGVAYFAVVISNSEYGIYYAEALKDSPPPPNAIGLEWFEAEAEYNCVVLGWQTGTEIDTLGFYLVRSENFVDYDLVNEQIIPAQGNPYSGSQYLYLDNKVSSGRVYHYWLVDIDVYGEYTIYGPVKAITYLEEKVK